MSTYGHLDLQNLGKRRLATVLQKFSRRIDTLRTALRDAAHLRPELAGVSTAVDDLRALAVQLDRKLDEVGPKLDEIHALGERVRDVESRLGEAARSITPPPGSSLEPGASEASRWVQKDLQPYPQVDSPVADQFATPSRFATADPELVSRIKIAYRLATEIFKDPVTPSEQLPTPIR